ncbi:MAG TPA: cupredoxin domain-containing protein [Candidatus Limnocylindrales bacterium]|nr:cupredoxin domain-containing protein [Candidatus Limnocylindrales bacterium]
MAAMLAGTVLVGCADGGDVATPPIRPGSTASPREVNLVGRDYGFSPPVVDLVPGETITLRFVNGGLEVHEAVIGGLDIQDAWEQAEAATVGHPPGPTPVVSVPPGLGGLRVVAASGQRVDATWRVPLDALDDAPGWYVGCHIPGHWAKGMVVPVRFVGADGRPLGSPPPIPTPVAGG